MNRIRKTAVLMLALALLCMPVTLAEVETLIQLSDDAITVNGAELNKKAVSGVQLQLRTETHEDVPEGLEGLENRAVTITEGGTYRISGAAQDTQIRVEAGKKDEVRLILDGADITCRTAPAIAVISAADSRQAGSYGVTIELAEGLSRINGSHTEETKTEETKLSGAITSLVSIGFEGSGFLDVTGDNEGIETKFGHMTFNGGNIMVLSGDDPLNASEDDVSVITVNAGTLHLQVNPAPGGEGDGMDSNGAIVINGGNVVSRAHPDSMDSGVDSDLGCTINGGIVLGAGNMYDEILAESGQLFMALQFAEKVQDKIVITTTGGDLVAVCEETGYTSYVMSSPDFLEGDYHLYLGGELTPQGDEMVYTPGVQLQHGGAGAMGFGGMPGMNMPQGMDFPGDMGQMPGGMQFPGMGGFDPGQMQDQGEGFDPGQRQLPPGMGFGGVNSAEVSTVFHLAPGSTMFSNIAAAE